MKKGIATYGIVLIFVALVGAFLVGAPQIVLGWANQVMGIIPNCNENNYNGNCICGIGERKIDIPWFGVPRWRCEQLDQLLVDPASSTFQQDAIAFATNHLEFFCGGTCDLKCKDENVCFTITDSGITYSDTYPNPDNPDCIEAIYGYGAQGARLVQIECDHYTEFEDMGTCSGPGDPTCKNRFGVCYKGTCWRGKTNLIDWDMEFFVESTTNTPNTLEINKFNNYCKSADGSKYCYEDSVCDIIKANSGNPNRCDGTLDLNIFPNNHPLQILGIKV